MENAVMFENYMNEVVSFVQERLPEQYAGCEVVLRTERKNNCEKTALVLQPGNGGTFVSPCLYPEDLFRREPEGTVLELCEKTSRFMNEALENTPKVDINAFLCDKNLFPALISTEKNRKLLETVPHREILDMSMVYRYHAEINDTLSGSCIVKNGMPGAGDEEKLHETAMRNLRNDPRFVPKVTDMFKMMLGMGMPEELLPETDPDAPKMYVVSNRTEYPAAAMTDPEFMRTLSEKYFHGESFLVLPSSVHEFIVTQMHDAPDGVNEMVREINETQVPPEEVLSDNAYAYDAAEGRIMLLSDYFGAEEY